MERWCDAIIDSITLCGECNSSVSCVVSAILTSFSLLLLCPCASSWHCKTSCLSLPHLVATCSWLAMAKQAKSPWKLSRKESVVWYLVESEGWASPWYPVEYLVSACRGQRGNLYCSDAVILTDHSLSRLMPETPMVVGLREEAQDGDQG